MKKREKIIINLLFLIFVLPVITVLVMGYMKVKAIVQRSPLNPLGLILKCEIYPDKLGFTLINPTNQSYDISITDVRMRGDYSAPALMTSGGFIGEVITIPANSSIYLVYSILTDRNARNIVRTWEKLGGSVTITVDYEDVKNGESGVLICRKP